MRRREFISLIGVMVAWPTAARAQQQPRIFRVAFVISSGSLAELKTRTRRGYGTFLEEMRKQGYDEGRNLIVDLFSGEGKEENYALDIPYYQTRKFDLVVNLKTAKTLGITMPPSVLARADEVIE